MKLQEDAKEHAERMSWEAIIGAGRFGSYQQSYGGCAKLDGGTAEGT